MNKKVSVFTVAGMLFLLAAFFLTLYNLWDDARANESAGRELEKLASDISANMFFAPSDESFIPDYKLNPEMDMPVDTIDGIDYIGVLRIPSLSLELPVISEWSYPGLKHSPCRYQGSAYMDNMVIAAHNYTGHFGKLNRLYRGDEVNFTDIEGNVFFYEVNEIEIVKQADVEEIKSDGRTLTLFTCTPGGQSRVIVRCDKREQNP